jgi:hypothetical protein
LCTIRYAIFCAIHYDISCIIWNVTCLMYRGQSTESISTYGKCPGTSNGYAYGLA